MSDQLGLGFKAHAALELIGYLVQDCLLPSRHPLINIHQAVLPEIIFPQIGTVSLDYCNPPCLNIE